MSSNDAVAVALVRTIRGGNLDALRRLLDEHAGLASVRLQDKKGGTRTPLHVAADWPGYFPNGAAIVDLLISRGADPNAPVTGSWHAETPLHWAASSDDVDVAAALIAGGANIEATGASIAGGAPIDDAVGYGCWHIARLLVKQGARVERLWNAAALGMMSRVEELLGGHPPPTPQDINDAFWQACAGGQRRVAEYLLARGAEINWIPEYTKVTPLDAAGTLPTRSSTMVNWLRGLDAKSAKG
ncbi:MAG: ankyrin repeat domain-containing protein [Terriglobales bacterium]